MDTSNGSAISGTLKWDALKTSQKMGTCEWETYYKFGSHQGSSDASLFSSSLPVLPHEKLITDSCIGVHSIDDISSKMDELDVKNAIEEIDLQGIGNLLPDEDELFDGILSDYNQGTLPSLEQVEDCDLFSSGGGIELDVDPMENVVLGIAKPSTTDGYVGNGNFSYNIANGIGSVAGEHPYGEHPSRTLFVRNINSNVDDSELRSLFEQYGDIRSMYTTCKHRGFVMISYYDIRHARSAMRALQDKPLRRRKLDIHFSIPKDNPSEKDLNQGTLVVFNLDPSVSNDDLRQIFGAFGEVKEIRETPHKKHHKFVEFYDVRAAEDALRSLNRSDIAGKRIKLEPSRPGGARRSLIQQLSPVDNEDMKNYRHQMGSPITNSPPGHWTHSLTWSGGNTVNITHSSEFTSMNPCFVSSSAKIAPIGKEHHRTNRGDPRFSKSLHLLNDGPLLQSHSFPEHGSGIMQNLGSNSSNMSPFGSISTGTSGVGTLTGSQFLWGSPNPSPELLRSPVWSIPSLGHAFTSVVQKQGFPYLNHGSHLPTSHHAGSAPSGIPFERKCSFFNDLPDPSFPASLSYGGKMVNPGILRGPINPISSISTNVLENGSLGFRMPTPQSLDHVFGGNLPYEGYGQSSMEGFTDRGRTFQADNSGTQSDSKKQFQLDIEKIINGEDKRTTLMIKNIPNKYTYKMLLASIDEHHRGTYDFLYLPIDIKNKCNVGYAFINMVSPSHIVSFYQAFNGKRWEKFNSGKVASLAYARIQGKAALDAHFQNSGLMNEDKRCCPILCNSEQMEALDQECLLSYVVSSDAQQQGTVLGEERVLEDSF